MRYFSVNFSLLRTNNIYIELCANLASHRLPIKCVRNPDSLPHWHNLSRRGHKLENTSSEFSRNETFAPIVVVVKEKQQKEYFTLKNLIFCCVNNLQSVYVFKKLTYLFFNFDCIFFSSGESWKKCAWNTQLQLFSIDI